MCSQQQQACVFFLKPWVCWEMVQWWALHCSSLDNAVCELLHYYFTISLCARFQGSSFVYAVYSSTVDVLLILLELHIKSCHKCREYSVFSSRRLVRSSHMTRDLLTAMITATILLYSHINTNAGKSYCASCPLTHSSGTFGIPQIHKLPFCSN